MHAAVGVLVKYSLPESFDSQIFLASKAQAHVGLHAAVGVLDIVTYRYLSLNEQLKKVVAHVGLPAAVGMLVKYSLPGVLVKYSLPGK